MTPTKAELSRIARGTSRRGAHLIAEGRGRLESDEAECCEHEARGEAVKAVGRSGGAQRVQRQAVATAMSDDDDREQDDDSDFGREQHERDPQRRPDALEREDDHGGGGDHPDHPQGTSTFTSVRNVACT